jgi:hypothetical protein
MRTPFLKFVPLTFADGFTPVFALITAELEHDVENVEKCLELLVKAGADVKEIESHRMTTLHFAAKQGNLFLAGKLIELGVDKDAVDKSQRTVSEIHKLRVRFRR